MDRLYDRFALAAKYTNIGKNLCGEQSGRNDRTFEVLHMAPCSNKGKSSRFGIERAACKQPIGSKLVVERARVAEGTARKMTAKNHCAHQRTKGRDRTRNVATSRVVSNAAPTISIQF